MQEGGVVPELTAAVRCQCVFEGGSDARKLKSFPSNMDVHMAGPCAPTPGPLSLYAPINPYYDIVASIFFSLVLLCPCNTLLVASIFFSIIPVYPYNMKATVRRTQCRHSSRRLRRDIGEAAIGRASYSLASLLFHAKVCMSLPIGKGEL